jgi:hypothetical protein
VNAQAAQTIWIKVEKPTFDLVGVIVSSLTIAGLCALTALVLGVTIGISIIVHRRRHPRPSFADASLQLLDARRP